MKNEQTTASHAPSPSSNPHSPEPGKEQSIFDLEQQRVETENNLTIALSAAAE